MKVRVLNNPVRRYAVPALERGLDILELFASREGGLSLTELGKALDLSPSAVFRSVVVLEERGYLTRRPADDTYSLSLRLFELGQARSPLRRLLDIAIPVMRLLAQSCGQASHLSVHDNGDLLVIADVESPGPLNLTFRLGSRWPMRSTVSGRVLLAHQSPEIRAAWLGLSSPAAIEADRAAAFAEIAARGHDRSDGETLFGVIDIGVPILSRQGAIAALTVSMIADENVSTRERNVLAELKAAGNDITNKLGGQRPAIDQGEDAYDTEGRRSR